MTIAHAVYWSITAGLALLCMVLDRARTIHKERRRYAEGLLVPIVEDNQSLRRQRNEAEDEAAATEENFAAYMDQMGAFRQCPACGRMVDCTGADGGQVGQCRYCGMTCLEADTREVDPIEREAELVAEIADLHKQLDQVRDQADRERRADIRRRAIKPLGYQPAKGGPRGTPPTVADTIDQGRQAVRIPGPPASAKGAGQA